MPLTDRRETLKWMGAAGSLCLVPSFGQANASDYNFVRIDGIPNQAVGEVLLKEVYKRAGFDINVNAMPGKRALQLASSGNADGETLRVFALGESNKSLIRVPTPLSSLKTMAFKRKDNPVNLSGKQDLENYSSVIVSGVLHTKAISEGVSKVSEVADPLAMFKMVNAGRADLALTSYLDGLAAMKVLGIDSMEGVEPALNEQPLFHYLHESKQDLVPTIDKIIQEMTESGELGELRAGLETDYLANL